MLYRELGQTGLQVSQIGFGCMSLPPEDEAGSITLLHRAIDNGINFFDTADLYDKGRNEIVVGKALQKKRSTVILASKAGNQWRPDGSGWDWNPSKQYILAAAEASLKRLQTDYIDLFQLHGGTIDDPINETIEAFELLKSQGKIRYYGISSIRPNVIREYVSRSSIVSVMMQYSLLDRRPEERILPLLQENKISVLVRGALAQGVLAHKPPREYLGLPPEAVKKVKEAIAQVTDKESSPSQTAIQYVLHQPVVAAAVVGIRNQDQLNDVLDSKRELTQREVEILRAAVKPIVYEQHR